MPVLRRIVFYLFLLLYLIVCPTTILYALGYVFEPGTLHGVLKTGLISLVTDPPGATVYIGGRRYSEPTPTVIRGLLPGEYGLKLLLTDHRPWVRTVPVQVEKATVLEKIVLLPNQPAPRALLPGPFDDLIPVPGTRFLLLIRGRSLEQFVVYDRDTGESWPLIPAASSFRGGVMSWHATVKESPLIVMRASFPAGDKVLGVELSKGRSRLTDLTGLFTGTPRWVAWDPRAVHRVFTFHDDVVDRLDTDGMALYAGMVTGAQGFGIHDGMLYVMTEDGALQRMDTEGRRAEALTVDPAVSAALSTVRHPGYITAWSDDLLAVLGARGELVVNRAPFRVVEDGARGLEFDPQHERLLVWRKDRLGVLNLSAAGGRDAPAPVENIRWLFEDGHDIAQAFWMYDGSHVLFRDGNRVFLLELETYGASALAELVRARHGSSVAYVEQSGQLYYVDPDTGQFCAIDVLPGKESRFLRRKTHE